MCDRKTLMIMAGGLALTAVAVIAAGVLVRRQTNKIRANMRSVSHGIYKFGSALQLLSGVDAEDEERCVGC